LVDDQSMIRDGLAVVLASTGTIEVVGEASDGAEALEACRRLRPDVVVMDIRMPVMDGIEATKALLAARPAEGAPRILILTTFDLDEYVYDALAAGASGFLLKDATASELINAVTVIHRGDALLAPSITRRLLADFTRRRPAGRASAQAVATLTARELEVVQRLAQGLSNAEVAQALFLSEQTVKSHVAHILLKLGLRDRTQVVVFAYTNGLA
jgi:DNA-binding NarL/FixJ family response regulator